MNNVIIISGGSDGLGQKLAEGLSPKNQVVILSPIREKLEKVSNAINCDFEVVDITKPDCVEKAVASILCKYGKIDCLINNAGIWIQGKLEENNYIDIDQTIKVNTLGAIYLTKAVIASMKDKKRGLIINVISQAGLMGKEERSVYNASKWAITGFTKSIQPEFAPFGIRVTGLYPGMMKTGMFKKVNIDKDTANGIETDEVLKAVQFLLCTDDKTVIPEIGIKSINN